MTSLAYDCPPCHLISETIKTINGPHGRIGDPKKMHGDQAKNPSGWSQREGPGHKRQDNRSNLAHGSKTNSDLERPQIPR
mmetsp:Transcript_51304/g.104373  ORF Transcript_51304/g.104373 Transcript_51304/m.104373 type:complete len:80 (+) Transcript_51304:623-862(+)